MWGYNDPEWDEEIVEGYTFKNARENFDGLKRIGVPIRIHELNPGTLHSLQRTCRARRPHYNAPPIGLRPVSEKEAAERFFLNTPFYTESKQIYPWDEGNQKPAFNRNIPWPWEVEGYEGYTHPKGKYERGVGNMIGIRLFYMWDGTGWGISNQYSDGRIIWFRFGCQHEWGPIPKDTEVVRPRLFRCQSFYYCVKCGHSEVIDSSD